MLHLYRRLLALRRTRPALHAGSLRLLDAPAGVLAYERRTDTDRVQVFVEFSGAPARIDDGCGTVLVGSTEPGSGRPFDGTLAPHEAVVVHPDGRA